MHARLPTFPRAIGWLALLLALAAPAWAGAASSETLALRFADAVIAADDAQGQAFAIVDKPAGRLWLFDASGWLLAASAVLVGQAPGDVAPADIGTRPLSRVRAHEKITAAGRYPTEAGRNSAGEDIVWLDYEAGLSLHRVRDVAGENRPTRLRTPTASDKRISFGCVNVPADFYQRHIEPLFAHATGVVYILPEAQPIGRLFAFARHLDAGPPPLARSPTPRLEFR